MAPGFEPGSALHENIDVQGCLLARHLPRLDAGAASRHRRTSVGTSDLSEARREAQAVTDRAAMRTSDGPKLLAGSFSKMCERERSAASEDGSVSSRSTERWSRSSSITVDLGTAA